LPERIAANGSRASPRPGYFNQHVVAVDADQRSRELLTTVQLFLHADPGLMPGPVGEILQTR
jgi:hypothetical protein